MRVDLFDFDLPEDRIALRPVFPREEARLLHIVPGGEPVLRDHRVGNLPSLLRPDDLLVFNDTRVLPAALSGTRRRGEFSAQVSVNLHKRVGDATWRAFARPAKRIAVGDEIAFMSPCARAPLVARVTEAPGGGEIVLQFEMSGAALNARLHEVGAMPLPPYIASKRSADDRDRDDYQTVYAREEGSVAAPTAGFHFTEALMALLRARGIETAFVTLHVGAGTFLPVKSDDTADHVMHAEYGEIDARAAQQVNGAKVAGRRVVAVGTTSLRLLESAADTQGRLSPFAAETDIFITPGYSFRVVDALVTNFHLPRSTLFMLVCALAGTGTMQAAYAHAIARGYRFYSYGDACLIEAAGRAA
ncbi:MAG: tRNA preQ1(34) S-adenosylmethionine ribosyltransferase-isomerase QueA [Rhodobiaceae bacterium]|nr:tRNA preQ1(34) S-adenosylmethionine ribosyltransferase-isomerase QueA [Rhodobiaceae bacterium]MCC0052810.1 tRNA preQ1(34) S-adenosylmethionine ribosyltransferase-isomerase QueA [Rhodobiaceae bacterium]